MNDPKNDGWEDSGQNNGTCVHRDREERAIFETGDTGKVYIREVGTSYGGLQEYDSEKHGTPNK